MNVDVLQTWCRLVELHLKVLSFDISINSDKLFMPEVSYQETEEWMENRNVAPCDLYLPPPPPTHTDFSTSSSRDFYRTYHCCSVFKLLQLAQSAL